MKVTDYKDCPVKQCKHFKPNEQYLSFCDKTCKREFYYDPNGGGMDYPEGIKDEFEPK
jgi:hypothetical protein